jgi:hypothetical protein
MKLYENAWLFTVTPFVRRHGVLKNITHYTINFSGWPIRLVTPLGESKVELGHCNLDL